MPYLFVVWNANPPTRNHKQAARNVKHYSLWTSIIANQWKDVIGGRAPLIKGCLSVYPCVDSFYSHIFFHCLFTILVADFPVCVCPKTNWLQRLMTPGKPASKKFSWASDGTTAVKDANQAAGILMDYCTAHNKDHSSQDVGEVIPANKERRCNHSKFILHSSAVCQLQSTQQNKEKKKLMRVVPNKISNLKRKRDRIPKFWVCPCKN